MSTRSFIGTIAPDGRFAGRYVHSDGYPTARGPVLTDILAAHDSDLAHVLDVLTIQHYGWSYLDAETTSTSETRLAGRAVAVAGFGLAYTTHQGQSHPDDWIIGNLGRCGDDVTWCDWGYAFTSSDAETAVLVMVGVERDGDGERYHERGRVPVRLLADLRVEDWTKIECGDGYERCCHYAWADFDVPDESRRLGTRTWLGQVPLAPPDAIGATVDLCGSSGVSAGSDDLVKVSESEVIAVLERLETRGRVERVADGADGVGRWRWALPVAQPRLQKGALQGIVEDCLTEHPDKDYSPGDLGKLLQRSSGAIANALDRLIERGVAAQTSQRPRRYRASSNGG